MTLDELEKQLEGMTLEQQVQALKVAYLFCASDRERLQQCLIETDQT